MDCELTDGIPGIYSVTNSDNQGPYIQTFVDGTIDDGILTITSMGPRNVPNPEYDGVGGIKPKVVVRDYGFGAAAGSVTVGGVPMAIISWNDSTIIGTVDPGTETGQLVVTRGDNGKVSEIGVTVQVGRRPGSRVRIVNTGGSIQSAIDAAGVNDLILVAPGFYDEMLIMWKPVQIQGWGAGSTKINAIKAPPEKLVAWRQHVELLSSEYDLVDGQTTPVGGIVADALFSEEGAGILVLAKELGPSSFSNMDNRGARIDGFTITGADSGGGVVVNGYADYLDISNNRVISNSGFYGGGVRVGHPLLSYTHRNRVFYTDSDNDNIRIRYNHITQNGGLDGAGGGVSMCTGSDDYEVSENFICGNFTLQDGAGIAHFGKSNNGIIQDNNILFNENFNQGMTVNGGGVSIAGKPPFGCPIDPVSGVADPLCLADPNQSLSPGSGSVQILRNLIQGNSSGAGDGAGIRLNRINGLEVVKNLTQPNNWYTVDIINNMIVNNVASLAGGGISLQDTVRTRILHNTIANNDNTSTAGEAFSPGQPNQSNPQAGAGIVSRLHSNALAGFLPAGEAAFSDPELVDNILWHNRKFYFMVDDADPANVLNGLCPDINNSVGLNCTGGLQLYDDLAVLPLGSGLLTPFNSLMTDTTGYENKNNISTLPEFVAEYANGNRESTVTNPEGTTALQPVVAFDEGGNFIRLRYGPLTQTRIDNGQLYGDYHIQSISTAVDAGTDVGITDDFDHELRPSGLAVDIGADEVQQVALLITGKGKDLGDGSIVGLKPLDSPILHSEGGLNSIGSVGNIADPKNWFSVVTGNVTAALQNISAGLNPVSDSRSYLRSEEKKLADARGEFFALSQRLMRIQNNPAVSSSELLSVEKQLAEAKEVFAKEQQQFVHLQKDINNAETYLITAKDKLASLRDDPASSVKDLSYAERDVEKAARGLEKYQGKRLVSVLVLKLMLAVLLLSALAFSVKAWPRLKQK